MARPGGHKDPAYLAATIAAQNITVLHFVPSMLRVFLEVEDLKEQCRNLRYVMASGEALSAELVERFFAQMPGSVPLHNLYGPTEAAVDVTHWTCEPGCRVVPIGRPVANTQIYILDRQMNPLPVGVPGELFIGGVQVGRGYHNRAELTREKFISDPFSREEGARLYRTGDLARYLPNGAIEYLARLDNQVKVRGFRIELRAYPNNPACWKVMQAQARWSMAS